MDRYVALLPKEPNPQDSYGELLRMAGNFEGSLLHYRAALKIDPDFVTSQLGLGDTYALMGNQEQARVEYDKAIRFAHNEADRLTYSMQKAMTFVRDGNYAEADKEYLADRRDRPRQGAGSAGSAGAAPHGGVSGRRQRRAEASEAGRGIAQPSLDDFGFGSRRRAVAHPAQPRRAGRPRRQPAAGRQVAAPARSAGQRQPQPRDPEFLSRRGWISAHGS